MSNLFIDTTDIFEEKVEIRRSIDIFNLRWQYLIGHL